MPRVTRGLANGHFYHVLNRGNGRQDVFHKDEDFQAFLNLLAELLKRFDVGVFAWCLMTNHFHLLLRPECGNDLSRAMQWLMTSHVRRYHCHYNSSGHVWQGRYKSFPVQNDEHLLTIVRYIEQNPVSAGMVGRAIDWPWSSHRERLCGADSKMTQELPIALPEDWAAFVDREMSEKELTKLQQSMSRQSPFGDDDWQEKMCRMFNLESTIRAKGRPKKVQK